MKGVIIEAYQRGRLIAVLPFVNKLLECCKGTKVFTPANPMIAGILSLLAELHAIRGLKINNVFSIELLFKAFGLSVVEVKPTDLLRHLPRERLQNQDWSVDALPAEPTPAAASAAQAMQAGAQAQAASVDGGKAALGALGAAASMPPGSLGSQAGAAGGAPTHTSLPPGMRVGPGGQVAAADAAAAAKAGLEAAQAGVAGERGGARGVGRVFSGRGAVVRGARML